MFESSFWQPPRGHPETSGGSLEYLLPLTWKGGTQLLLPCPSMLATCIVLTFPPPPPLFRVTHLVAQTSHFPRSMAIFADPDPDTQTSDRPATDPRVSRAARSDPLTAMSCTTRQDMQPWNPERHAAYMSFISRYLSTMQEQGLDAGPGLPRAVRRAGSQVLSRICCFTVPTSREWI